MRETNTMENNLDERQPEWKTHLIKENYMGRKPYRKMTLACLASQLCTELGPAQPQLVYKYSYLSVVEVGLAWVSGFRV